MTDVRESCGLTGWGHWSAMTLLLLVLGGCSGGIGANSPARPPPAPTATDPNVLPQNHRQQIVDFMRVFLVDPVKVRDAYISDPAIKPYGGSTHYVSCVRYNPRDAGGQYEGNTERAALFLGGRLNQFLPATPELCRGVVYQRFPEAEVMVP